jgi:hypothetical protein
VLPEGTATAPTPIGFDREIVGELAVAEEREWLVTTGTWLIGPFVDAHLRVHRDAVAARRFLDRSVTTSAPPPSAPSRRSSTGMRPFPLKGCYRSGMERRRDLRVTAKLDHQPTPSGSPTSSEESVSA